MAQPFFAEYQVKQTPPERRSERRAGKPVDNFRIVNRGKNRWAPTGSSAGRAGVMCEKRTAPEPKKERPTRKGGALYSATDTRKGGAQRMRPTEPGTAIIAQVFENVKPRAEIRAAARARAQSARPDPCPQPLQ